MEKQKMDEKEVKTAREGVPAESAVGPAEPTPAESRLPEEISLKKQKQWTYEAFTAGFHALLTDPAFIQFRRKRESPNIFNIVGQTRKELCHSSVIAWLLNSEGSHGLGDFALKNLLHKMYAKAKGKAKEALPEPYQIDFGSFENVMIRPKFAGRESVGELSVNFEKYKTSCNFDIALSAEIRLPAENNIYRFMFICENKVDSGENKLDVANPDGTAGREKVMQTKMYAEFWKDRDQAFFPLDARQTGTFYRARVTTRLALLFLSAKKDKADSKDFVNLDYSDLYESVLLPALKNPNLTDSGKKLIQEYVDLLDLEDIIVSKETQRLMRDIFQRNRDVLEAYLSFKLFRHLFSEKTTVSEGKPTEKPKVRQILAWLARYTGVDKFWVHYKKDFSELDLSISNLREEGLEYSPDGTEIFWHPISLIQSDAEKNAELAKGNTGRLTRFLETWNGFREKFNTENKCIFNYIDGIDNRDPEFFANVTALLADFYRDHTAEVASYYLEVIRILSITYSYKDRSYLRKKLPTLTGDMYPVVYFSADKQKQHPIFINAEEALFAFKNAVDGNEPGQPQCGGQEEPAVNWVSGNRICQMAAEKLQLEVRSNYTWFNYLRYLKNDKLVALPQDDASERQ